MLIKLDPKYEAGMMARGLNRLALATRPFKLKPVSFTAKIEGLKPKFIEGKQQLDWYSKILDNPFRPWCFCITSEPNDKDAKLAAAFLMQRAFELKGARIPPLWHDLMGGFENPLLDSNNMTFTPSMLVISNVLPNSTNTKIEKLRDILERYSKVPRIVVSAGMDPFSFFQKHLYYPLSGCLYLKTGLVKTDVEI